MSEPTDNLPAAAASPQPCEDKPMRSRDEIYRALEILLQSVNGAEIKGLSGIAATSAMAAIALSWVMRIEGPDAHFQSMIDHCNELDRRDEKRHTHTSRRKQGARLRDAAGKAK